MNNSKQQKIFKIINAQILEALKNNEIPSIKPSIKINGSYFDFAFNYFTERQYTGINRFLLPPNGYVTFNQIKEYGLKLKDEHNTYRAYQAWFTTWYKIKNEDGERLITKDTYDKENRTDKIIDSLISCTYSYTIIFSIDDIENLPERELKTGKKKPFVLVASTENRNPLADLFLNAYVKKEKIKVFEGENSYYSPKDDTITLKSFTSFNNANSFYEQYFHEASHSTGAYARLNRKSIVEAQQPFGGTYNFEEIVAETAAMYCLKEIGMLTNVQVANCITYIKGYWQTEECQKEIAKDPSILAKALTNAERAFNYIFKKERYAN